MKRLCVAGSTLAAVLLAFLGPAPPGRAQESVSPAEALDLPEHPTRGSHLFVLKGCVHCHAIQGQGGTDAPDLGKIRFSRSLLDMAGVLWNHSPQMSRQFERAHLVRPSFTVQEMSDLTVFLYFLNYFDAPGDPEEGRVLFAEKHCIRCHSVGGEPGGGRIGPELDAYARYPSPLVFLTGLWNHGRRMSGAMLRQGIELPELRRTEMAHLLAYIRQAGQDTVTERVLLRPGSPGRGRELFHRKSCAQCHPVHRGEEGIGPNLNLRVRGSLTQIAGAMWSHGPQMWKRIAQEGIAFPELSVEEMSDLVSYLYFLQYYDEPGDVERGGRLFEQKGCSACHAASVGQARGGPDLAGSSAFDSPIHVVTAFWNHLPAMEQLIGAREMSWPTFEPGELADLVEYIHSHRAKPSP
jgi:cytochrome c2